MLRMDYGVSTVTWNMTKGYLGEIAGPEKRLLDSVFKGVERCQCREPEQLLQARLEETHFQCCQTMYFDLFPGRRSEKKGKRVQKYAQWRPWLIYMSFILRMAHLLTYLPHRLDFERDTDKGGADRVAVSHHGHIIQLMPTSPCCLT